MESLIQKSMNSKAVQSLHLKEIDLWSLFFDSGCDYLDQLRNRIAHNEVFKAQFGELLEHIGIKLTPEQTFRKILTSPLFWNWWSTQLWRVCYNFGADGSNEIYIRLMFNTALIPQNTLEKIFPYERQTKQEKPNRMSGITSHRTSQVC